jgi:HSP20 family molecular chaperone IbpA
MTEDIQITPTGVFSPSREGRGEVTDDDRFMRERSYGSFVRTIPLRGVSADKIDAVDKGS